MHLSSTTVSGVEKILDFGETVGIGTATHHLTMYRVASGALVFGAGTVQWAWGLDGNHDRGAAAPDDAMQQATVNLFADMGAQPGSLQNGLVAASKSTDTFGPTSSVTSPANGGTVGGGDRVTITGTAADSGGVVAGVEVSVDGGATWRAAQGTSSWSFEWMAGLPGSVTILSRAVDDSGNREEPGAGITVSIVGGLCPCPSLWTQATVPPVPDVDDPSPVELGLKFRSDVSGFVKGVRFYKSTNNTGTHIGNLWTSTGTRLATATFAAETPSGWQQVLFDEPVPVTANATYVVSYHTNVGHYAASSGYLSSMGVDAPPLHAPTSAAAGGNGLFLYGPTAFPTQTFNATNYWVDVVFDSTPDTTAPSIADVVAVPLDGTTAIVTWTTNEPSTSSVDYSTEAAFLPESTQTVSDAAFVTSHHVTLSGLRPSTSYFFRVRSTDRSGNMASKPSLGPAPPPVPGGPPPPPPQAFTMPSPTLRDTMPADFAAGVASGTYIAESGDGELTLAPSIGVEFSGTTMPSGWKTHIWSEGGTATVGGGRMTADGVRVASCVDAGGVCQDQFTLAPGTSLEFVATFTGDPYQHSGLGRTLETSDEPFALFSTLSGGSLNVRTYTGDMSTNETVTNLGTALVNSPHRYRIDWQASQVVYSVDGEQVATHPVAISGMMRPVAASDFNAFSGKIVVDWIHVSPYTPASGTFQSRIFDAGLVVNWGSVEWTAATPAGTSLAITVCTSNTLTASGSLENPACTPAIATSPQGLSSSSRYVQYRADLATGDARVTPELSDIRITGSVPPVQALDHSGDHVGDAGQHRLWNVARRRTAERDDQRARGCRHADVCAAGGDGARAGAAHAVGDLHARRHDALPDGDGERVDHGREGDTGDRVGAARADHLSGRARRRTAECDRWHRRQLRLHAGGGHGARGRGADAVGDVHAVGLGALHDGHSQRADHGAAGGDDDHLGKSGDDRRRHAARRGAAERDRERGGHVRVCAAGRNGPAGRPEPAADGELHAERHQLRGGDQDGVDHGARADLGD